MVGMLTHIAIKIYSGRDKSNDAPVTITTWQSVYKLERSFFEEYNVVIGDEAHLFQVQVSDINNDKITPCKV